MSIFLANLALPGKSYAKGRNGYFHLASAEITDIGSMAPETPIRIDFKADISHSIGPARLELNHEDALALIGFLSEHVTALASSQGRAGNEA